jgi:hypothetical protein
MLDVAAHRAIKKAVAELEASEKREIKFPA